MLPDGSSCSIPLRQGASIRQVLLELCQKQHINLAAVDLFLTGGEKVERHFTCFIMSPLVIPSLSFVTDFTFSPIVPCLAFGVGPR